MNKYSTPLALPTRSAFGPLARRGSRTSMHSAERVSQWADSNLDGMRSSIGDGCTLADAGVFAAAAAARLAASVAAAPVAGLPVSPAAPGVTPPTMRVGTALAS